MELRISNHNAEGTFQASKWLKLAVLCDEGELAELLDGSFAIVPLTGIFDGKVLEPSRFVSVFAEWIAALKQGKVPTDRELRKILACAWVHDRNAIWLQEVVGKGFLAKIARPVVQVQAHFFSYSSLDGQFRSMSMGEGSVFWGLQFSYPQVYQDPQTMEIDQVGRGELFEKIQTWSRERTRPTPFIAENKKTNVPIR
ncbi:MAG: hypothetical protein HY069_02830, partial [Chlamydiia bacterium]|nr:hypothetical protein [Chlamydiia bacterium]